MGKTSKKQKAANRKVLKVKHPVAPVVTIPPELPEPVKDLIEAVHAGEVAEIHLHDHVEPTRWERLKKWLAGDDTPATP